MSDVATCGCARVAGIDITRASGIAPGPIKHVAVLAVILVLELSTARAIAIVCEHITSAHCVAGTV